MFARIHAARYLAVVYIAGLWGVFLAENGWAATPDPPNNLKATFVSCSFEVKLSWSDSSNNEDGFRIFRSLDGSTYTSIADVGRNITEYNDKGVQDLTKYYYRVNAFNSGGLSQPSNIVDTIVIKGYPIMYFTRQHEPVYLLLDPRNPSFNLTEDYDDFFEFADSFGKKKCDPDSNVLADINDDGVVDIDDFFLFAEAFGRTAWVAR